MSATITWVIEYMNCIPTDGSLTDVVVTAGWRCNGAETSGDPAVNYTSTVYSTASFPMPEEGQFTPYADLTQSQVLGWIWANGVDQTATEAAVAQQIANQVNPPVVTPALPWSAA